jgi:hypothetical protein
VDRDIKKFDVDVAEWRIHRESFRNSATGTLPNQLALRGCISDDEHGAGAKRTVALLVNQVEVRVVFCYIDYISLITVVHLPRSFI